MANNAFAFSNACASTSASTSANSVAVISYYYSGTKAVNKKDAEEYAEENR